MRRGLHAQHDIYIGGVVVASVNEPPTAGFPRAPIDIAKGIAGWRSGADGDDSQNDMPAGRRGEQPYPRTSRGKTLTYNIVPQVEWSDGLDGLEEYLDGFAAACADLSSLVLLVATPWPDLPGEPGDIWGAFGRLLPFTCDEVQSRGPNVQPSPWQRDAQLSVRLLDGRWLWLNESGTFLQRMHWDDTSAVNVTNNGPAPTEPIITVSDVDEGDDLHLIRADRELWFRNPVGAASLTGSHDVIVDFAQRKTTVEGINVRQSYDAAASNWWDEFADSVPPGTHTITRGPGAGTHIAVELFSASW